MQFSQPSDMEEGFNMIQIALEKGFPGLIVIDSIPACNAKELLEAKIEDAARPGYNALQLTRCIEKILKPMANTWAMLLCLNQRRAIIGKRAGKFTPEDEKFHTPGGFAFKHYASVRLQMTLAHGESWEAREKRSEIKVRSVKNKLGMPYQDCLLHLHPGIGFIG